MPTAVLGVAAGAAIVSIILSLRAPKLRWLFVLALATILGALRFNFARTFDAPEPQASLLTGILLGDDSGIPKSVQDAFRTTGTSHTPSPER